MNKPRISSSFYVIFLGVMLICGCNSSENSAKALLKKFIPPADDQFAQDYIETIKQHNDEKALALLPPEIRKTVQTSYIESMAYALNAGEITSKETIGCHVSVANDKKRIAMTYQYHIGEQWVVIMVIVENVNGKQQILGFHMHAIPKSLQELNTFTWTGKGSSTYMFLVLMAMVFGFMLYTLVLCLKSKIKKKWLWIIIIFAGIGQLTLDWTTGQIFFDPFHIGIQLFGIAAIQNSSYAPWVMTIIPPVGAVVFLFIRRKLIDNDSKETPAG